MSLEINRKVYLEKEFYIGLFSILLGIILINASDRNSGLYVIYPRSVFGGMIGIGILMVLMALVGKESHSIVGIKVGIHELLLLVMFVITRPLVQWLGLYSALFLVNMIVTVMVKKDKRPKSLFMSLMFNLILMVVLYLVFAVALNVNSPKAWLV